MTTSFRNLKSTTFLPSRKSLFHVAISSCVSGKKKQNQLLFRFGNIEKRLQILRENSLPRGVSTVNGWSEFSASTQNSGTSRHDSKNSSFNGSSSKNSRST